MNAKVHVSLGKLYYAEKGLYYESVTAYKKAIDLDPRYLDARMGLAEVYEDKGLYKEAIEEYRKVVDADAKNTGALYNLALVYEKVDPKESITLWERYIGLAGNLPAGEGLGGRRAPAPAQAEAAAGQLAGRRQFQQRLELRLVEAADHLVADHDHRDAHPPESLISSSLASASARTLMSSNATP